MRIIIYRQYETNHISQIHDNGWDMISCQFLPLK
jgi:hypothetical protein